MSLDETLEELRRDIDTCTYMSREGFEITNITTSVLKADIDAIEQVMDRYETENAKLRELVSHLMYVKPPEINAILHKGKIVRFDDLLEEVGLKWESVAESAGNES